MGTEDQERPIRNHSRAANDIADRVDLACQPRLFHPAAQLIGRGSMSGSKVEARQPTGFVREPCKRIEPRHQRRANLRDPRVLHRPFSPPQPRR